VKEWPPKVYLVLKERERERERVHIYEYIYVHTHIHTCIQVKEWPEVVYFVVDVHSPGITMRLLREKTWRSTDPSVRLRHASWNDKNQTYTY
jgi:hypothetical protein